jgi:hypothetical protein
MTYKKSDIAFLRAAVKRWHLATWDKSGMSISAIQLKDSLALDLHDPLGSMTGHTAYYSTMLRRGSKRKFDYLAPILSDPTALRRCSEGIVSQHLARCSYMADSQHAPQDVPFLVFHH